ncbi:MAG: 4Fe-4S binding protein [Tannerellaceae bacterium]|nr:4Fe-4S binding protein [Tannerellaceae bacterium]
MKEKRRKKPLNYLKGLRAMLAILFFAPVLLYFVDFAGALPENVHGLLHLQLVPAALGGMIGIIVLMFALAFVFGRIYCSVICPAGILQDIINRVFCIKRKKQKGVMRFKYRKPMNMFRYALLTLTVASALFGATTLLLKLDPYSNFGRIASNLFRPLVMWGNNAAFHALEALDNHSLYPVTVKTVTTAGWAAAAIALLTFIAMTIWRGRLFCNSLCPVGAVLSIVSRYSLFRISFDAERCNSCGSCERSCKAEAVDSKRMKVDTSLCVLCFNCTSTCPKASLKYRFAPAFPLAQPELNVAEASHTKGTVNSTTSSRRKFFATGATIAATLPMISSLARKHQEAAATSTVAFDSTKDAVDYNNLGPVTPPGSMDLERFKDKCTACHICITRCPTQVLRPAGLEYGFDYMLRPHCAFVSSYCNYDCTVCSEVCPSHAIGGLSIEEKHTTQVGIATFNLNRCVVYTNETDCGACAEHCPTRAVHMVHYKGILTIPQVEPELCIGCGGCESICPVRPLRAIVVVAHKTHVKVAAPEEEEVEKIENNEFAF